MSDDVTPAPLCRKLHLSLMRKIWLVLKSSRAWQSRQISTQSLAPDLPTVVPAKHRYGGSLGRSRSYWLVVCGYTSGMLKHSPSPSLSQGLHIPELLSRRPLIHTTRCRRRTLMKAEAGQLTAVISGTANTDGIGRACVREFLQVLFFR